jgi:hypothetical protein
MPCEALFGKCCFTFSSMIEIYGEKGVSSCWRVSTVETKKRFLKTRVLFVVPDIRRLVLKNISEFCIQHGGHDDGVAVPWMHKISQG